MSWVKSQKLWRKWAYDPVSGKHKWFTVSPRQLRAKYGRTLEECPDDKEGSWPLANLWWQEKEFELAAAGKPPPRPLADRERIAFANAGIPPEEWEKQAREWDGRGTTSKVVNASLAMLASHLLKEGSLPPEVAAIVSAAGGQQLEEAGKVFRGESPTPSDRSVRTFSEKWLKHQQAQVAAGQMTAARAANNRTCLEHFLAFLGEADISTIDAERLDSFYLHVVGKIRRPGKEEGWSVAYAKDVFSVARSFIRYSWAQCGGCDLPRNIDFKFKFGSPAKKVATWTPIEFMRIVSEAPGKLKLCLLLMANTGSTQQDVSDLLDEEVDWEQGSITRKRSKTKDKENVPTVSYKLWPETFALLRKYRSGTERVLLTESGQPYVRTTLNPTTGKLSKADGFASNYVHLKKRLAFAKPMKQLRKLGASLLAKHEVYGRFASYFLGHSPRTVADRHYVTPPQELFDEAVTWLGRQLGQVPST
jgi:integrase